MTQTLAETEDQGEKAKEGPPVSTPQIRQMVSIKLLATVMGGEPEPTKWNNRWFSQLLTLAMMVGFYTMLWLLFVGLNWSELPIRGQELKHL